MSVSQPVSNQSGYIPSLALTVVSYNSASYLPVCLESLLADSATYSASKVKIAVVENGTDLTSQEQVSRLANDNPNLKWFRAPSNLGYAGGANFGWESLGKADIYIVLNPDMRFCPGWLAALVAPFEADPQIGIVGCKLLDAEGKIQHAGGLITHGTALGLHFGAGEADDGRWDDAAEVEFVTGAALAIKSEVLKKVGGFDEHFFPGYYEDVDLCARVRQAGYKVWYTPHAVAYHYEGGSFGRSSGYYRAFHRNRLRYVLKNLPASKLLYNFVRAERTRLRGTLATQDRRAGEVVYRKIRNELVNSQFPQAAVTENELMGEEMLKNASGNLNLEVENNQIERLEEQVAEVKASWKVEERPFKSGLPFIATLREKFNSISTKWYVRPILQQQVDFNASVARTLETLGQLTAGRDVASDMEYTVLASRLTTLEERLERIETLLEKLVETKEA